MKWRSLALLFVLSVALVPSSWWIARGGTVVSDRGISDNLTETQLLQLFFSREIAGPFGLPVRSELRLGELPAELPAELPQLPEAEVMFSETALPGAVGVLLSVGRSLPQVQQFYEEQFRRNGWQRVQMEGMGWIAVSIQVTYSHYGEPPLGFPPLFEEPLTFEDAQRTASVRLTLKERSPTSTLVWAELSAAPATVSIDLEEIESQAESQETGFQRPTYSTPLLISTGDASRDATRTTAKLRQIGQLMLEARDATLLAGQLPNHFPFRVSVPEGTEILGSIVVQSGQSSTILNTNQSPERLQEFYSNWARSTDTSGRSTGAFLCSNARAFSVVVRALPMNQGGTNAQINLRPVPEADSICQESPPN